MLQTSAEWQALKPLTIVLDPDGWDRKNYQFSWHEELITEDEYKKRTSISTCQWKRCKPHDKYHCASCN